MLIVRGSYRDEAEANEEEEEAVGVVIRDRNAANSGENAPEEDVSDDDGDLDATPTPRTDAGFAPPPPPPPPLPLLSDPGAWSDARRAVRFGLMPVTFRPIPLTPEEDVADANEDDAEDEDPVGIRL